MALLGTRLAAVAGTPAGQTVRTTGTGPSSAHITAVLTATADSADSAGNKATMLTIVRALVS